MSSTRMTTLAEFFSKKPFLVFIWFSPGLYTRANTGSYKDLGDKNLQMLELHLQIQYSSGGFSKSPPNRWG